ncbi:MAG: glycogen synthase, partial [Clostridia bacterium]|nr:glycogen synthase [Clostridia bacterium]
MKVFFVSSEVVPFAKSGGLADVAGTLPLALAKSGVDVRVCMPLYGCIGEEYRSQMRFIKAIEIPLGWRKQYCGIFELDYKNIKVYFIDNEFYFIAQHLYGYIHEDFEKFAFFSKAALSILPDIDFRPDVIHVNDWQSAAIPVLLNAQFQDNPFYRGIKTVITIHNLLFQGIWDKNALQDVLGLDASYLTSDKLEYKGDVNMLKGGLVYADAITTVSETYAREIQTPEYGEGLDGLMRARDHQLTGIVNGLSYEQYNPATDEGIYKMYNARNFVSGKAANKLALQKDLGLAQNPDSMLIGIVSRLTSQKGFDLIAQIIAELAKWDVQLVVLGTGDSHYENMFHWYSKTYPDKFAARICFDNNLAHKIYAGSDAFLMPSRFEPCGLSQIISMKYGTLPIVRETGGLKD